MNFIYIAVGFALCLMVEFGALLIYGVSSALREAKEGKSKKKKKKSGLNQKV